jgi:organic hydroperoxide reductase OsmC/OhrA
MFERGAIALGHPIGAAATAIGGRNGHANQRPRRQGRPVDTKEMRGRPRRSMFAAGYAACFGDSLGLHGKAKEAQHREREDHLRRDDAREKVAVPDATIWT